MTLSVFLYFISKMAKFDVLAADIIEVIQGIEINEKLKLYFCIHVKEESEKIISLFYQKS